MKLLSVFPGGKTPSLEGCTLVVPSVSVGNVGQLAVDLFVSTLKLDLAGYIEDENLLPAVGLDAYTPAGTGTVALPGELFLDASSKVAYLQLRSATITGRACAFGQSLTAWAREAGFKSVLILGSTEATARRDADILAGTRLRYVTGKLQDGSKELAEPARKLVEAAEKLGLQSLTAAVDDELRQYASKLAPWTYVSALEDEKEGLPAMTLLAFAAEGDNTLDAVQMASIAHAILVIASGNSTPEQLQWTPPPSWAAVFGRPIPSDIY